MNLQRQAWVLPFFLMAAGLFCLTVYSKGWITHDEGVLAQTAERALHGELPHRDFDEPYSEGLTWINAASFRLFGVRFLSMRAPLLFFYLLFLASLYSLALRWVSPAKAALIGFVCLGWGLPAYFAALPSWYNTFFAGYGAWFLIKHSETRQRRWLFAAGLMAGLSFCIKVVGLYFAMAGVIYVLYAEGLPEHHGDPPLRREAPILLGLKAAAWAVVLSVLLAIFWKRLDLKVSVYFLLPAAAISAVPLFEEWRHRSGPWRERVKKLVLMELAFLAGSAAPVALLVFYNWRIGALGALWTDLFVLPQRRFDFSFYALPPLWTLLSTIPVGLLLWSPSSERRWPRSAEWLVGAIFLGVALLGNVAAIYNAFWMPLRPLVPFLSCSGALLLLHPSWRARWTPLKRQQLFICLVVMTFVAIVQFPDSFGIYFCYISAFVVLAALALFQRDAPRQIGLGSAILFAYGVFGLLWISHGDVRANGRFFTWRRSQALLSVDRAGLWVGAEDAAMYEGLIQAVQAHSMGADYIFAGPDSPEVYFLTGKKNPTRVFYEFFAPDHADPGLLLRLLSLRHVKVVVINRRPEFSSPYPKTFWDALVRRYPRAETIGRFVVLW